MKKQLRALFLIFTLLPSISFAWYNCSWTYRLPLVIGNTSGSTISNTVLEVHLNASDIPNYVWANADKDLRFVDSDDSTLLSFFVMPHKTTDQELLVWVKVPTITTAGKTIYVYYGNSAATTVSNPSGVLVTGIRMWTRSAAAISSLSTYNSWWNAWNAAPPYSTGYGCQIINSMNGVSNNSTISGGNASNIIFSYVSVIQAPSSGAWYLRHGPDYGYGGGLYFNDVALQEKYGTDLWWNTNWTDASQLLQGSSALTKGSYYVMRSYGGEPQNDGLEQMQLGLNANYQALSTANFSLFAPPCEAPGVTKTVNNQIIAPTLTKSVVAYSDPINNTTNPRLIPGGRARYTLTISNPGGPTLDANSINLTDSIPNNTKLYVSDINGSGSGPVIFTQGGVTSGLTYTKATDLTYSSNSGSSYAYTPTADTNGFDTNVTNIKINLKGTFACSTSGTSPSATIQFDVGVK